MNEQMNLFRAAADDNEALPDNIVDGLKLIATDVLEDYISHTWPRNNQELYGCLLVSRELRRRKSEATQ